MQNDRLTEKQLRAFHEWLDNTNYCFYDCEERLIDLKTRRLYSFDEIYAKFIADTVDTIPSTDYQKNMLNHLHQAITQ